LSSPSAWETAATESKKKGATTFERKKIVENRPYKETMSLIERKSSRRRRRQD
jgi:hypothetical protein